MSGAVAFVFGLCALSFAAGCGLTAYLLRRDPEPAPPPAPEVPEVELKLDVVWPPEDYATKPIHRNPVMGLPVTERPAEPVRPALTLVPDPDPVVDDREPEPVVVESPAQPEAVVVELPHASVDVPAQPEPTPRTVDLPVQPLQLPDPAEFRQRYLRSFEEARRRGTRN